MYTYNKRKRTHLSKFLITQARTSCGFIILSIIMNISLQMDDRSQHVKASQHLATIALICSLMKLPGTRHFKSCTCRAGISQRSFGNHIGTVTTFFGNILVLFLGVDCFVRTRHEEISVGLKAGKGNIALLLRVLRW